MRKISRFLTFTLGLIALASVTSSLPADSTSSSAPAQQPLAPSNVPTPQAPPATAESQAPSESTPATGSTPTTFWTQNYLTGNWGGFRDELKNDGISFTPALTSEVFGNPSGGAKQGVITDGLLTATLDVDFDALTKGAVKDLTFHVSSDYVYGPSLTDHFIGGINETSNVAAYNSLRLQELWLQKLFWDKKLSLKVGNMSVDNEYFQSNSASLFINATFGAFSLIANNVAGVAVYPLATPGVRLQFLPTDATYIMAGVYGKDNADNQATNNQNGLRFALNRGNGMLIMSEAGYLLNLGPKDKGLQGTYRIGAWIDTDNHTTLDSQAEFANGTGLLQDVGTDYGVYGVLDQQIYSQDSRIVSYFVRCGGAPSNTNYIDYYIESGFNFTGFIPGRDNDVGGIAMGRSHVSDNYSQSQILQGNPPSTAETVIEATYKVQMAPWWSIQPDIQYIVTPSGVEGSRNALALGLRTNIAF